jgi:hypothetical protein
VTVKLRGASSASDSGYETISSISGASAYGYTHDQLIGVPVLK